MPRVLAGRYRLDLPVGHGGMGQVWKATDQVLGRSVAAKVVDLEAALDPATAARFAREAQATARLAHPNVVTVFDAGADDQSVFLIMELLAGPTLADVIVQHGQLGIDYVVHYGQEICAGLAAAHAAGVIHRDLKPANLMFAAAGTLKIVDFGIARIVIATTTQQRLTATSMVVGTPGYVAPEQALAGTIDARTDLYALGCVLFALLIGRPPYAGATPLETLGQHLHAPIPAIAELRPDVPLALSVVITDLLAKDPEDRPQTAGEVAACLTTVSQQTGQPDPAAIASTAYLNPTATLPPPEAPATGLLAGIPPRTRAGVAAAAILLVIGVVVWLTLGASHGSPPAPTTTTTPSPATKTTTPVTTTSTTTTTTTTTVTPTTPTTPAVEPGHPPSPKHPDHPDH